MSKKVVTKPSVQNSKHSVFILLLAGLLILGGGIWLWWQKVYNDPARVFWAMVNNNLSTHSVTRHVTQGEGNESLEQWTRLNLTGGASVYSKTILKQPAEAGENVVTTESIGLTGEDFVRYQTIQTDQKSENGQPLDFSNIVGVWSRQELAEDSGENTGRFLKEALLGTFPMANLKPDQRRDLINFMRSEEIYKIDYSQVRRQREQGRTVFVYSAELKSEAYAKTLQQYARSVGLGELAELDPEAFADYPPIKLEITVDALSRQLVRVKLPDSGRQEEYSSYGVNYAIGAPGQTVPVEELEKRLQNVN